MLQRLALYATLGLVLDAMDQSITTAGFWCILALFIASEWLTRRETLEQVHQELQAMKQRYLAQQESEEAANDQQPK